MNARKSDSSWHDERIDPNRVPWYLWIIAKQHLARYRFTAGYIKGKQVADIACGMGYGSEGMITAGARSVLGLDISVEAINHARAHFRKKGLRFIVADALQTGIPASSIDVVVSLETLEHVRDAEAFIKETRRVLKPGGLLIVSAPNGLAALGRNPFHKREIDIKQFSTLLKPFSGVVWFGQTPMVPGTINVIQIVNKVLPSRLKILAAIRPWEGDQIEPLSDMTNMNFRTFLAVARK